MKLRGHLICAAIWILCSGWVTGAEECPAAGAARLDGTDAQLAERAAIASRSEDLRCAALGRALADALDRSGAGACEAADRLSDAVTADELSLRAGLEWRCGRVRAAHESALEVLAFDETATLAWVILAQVLEARFYARPARQAYEQAIAQAPEEYRALRGLARLARTREERRSRLEEYIEHGSRRGESLTRMQSARENLAMSRALGERETWIVESLELPATIRLQALSNSPGDLRGYLMNLRLGGKRALPALLDSGASGLHLAHSVGRRAAIEALAGGQLFGGGGKGEHDIVRGLLETVDLGPLVYRQGLGVVAAGSLHPRGRYQAIVGLDLFGGLEVVFDPDGGKLLLAEVTSEREESDGETDPREVDPWPGDPETVPILRVEGQLLLPVHLGSDRMGEGSLALLDTGASRTLVDESLVTGWPGFRRESSRKARGYGGAMALAGRLHKLEVGFGGFRTELRKVLVLDLSSRSRLTGIQISAFVGLDLLRDGVFVIDLKNGTVTPR